MNTPEDAKNLIRQTLANISKFNDLSQDLKAEYKDMYSPSDASLYMLDPHYTPSDDNLDWSDDSDSTYEYNYLKDVEDYWTSHDKQISFDLKSLWTQYNHIIQALIQDMTKLIQIKSLKHDKKIFIQIKHTLETYKAINELDNATINKLQWLLQDKL